MLPSGLQAQHFAVITFNFSHNGVYEQDFDELDKFGLNTYSQEQKDLSAVLTVVLEGRLPLAEQLDTGQIFLVGHSRGGGNSVLFAAEHPEIRGVVAWNGIADGNLFGEEFREQVLRDGVGYVANARTKQQMPINAVFFEDLDRNRERFDIPARAASLADTCAVHSRLAGFRTIACRLPHLAEGCAPSSLCNAGRGDPYIRHRASFCRDDG